MNEMITISQSEYSGYKLLHEKNEKMREEILSLQALVQQLRTEISLMQNNHLSFVIFGKKRYIC
ncbi:MAG: hypothetical protein LBF05_04385 [Tannerella sp.]|jgi:uncharacterized protein YlxW (UPF0749 family)|nr:hypothetical protein [Tannerella sp.]